MWTCKMHFLEDGEFFEYDTFGGQGSMATQKALPYLESLLSFLEMDCAEWESLIQQACGDLEQFLTTKDVAYTDHMMQLLGELGEKHVYFKLLYLRWFWRKASESIESGMTKELRQLPEQLSLYQKQAQKFVENILDVDRVDRDVQKNVRANYVFDQPREAELFCFKPIPVSFGPVDENTCGTILYPNAIRDMIDFSLRDCVEKNIPLRRCRNCGRYFPIIGRITAEYCSRPQPSGKLCRNIAPVQKWSKNSKKDLVFSEYRREYKRHFAWIKAGKISEEEFAAWAKQAKAKKHECDVEQLSLDEFKVWLKNS